jgi:hypothetical protein
VTSNGYITASPGKKKIRVSDKIVKDSFEAVIESIQRVKIGLGQIWLRCSFEDKSVHKVELFGEACKISNNNLAEQLLTQKRI